MHKGLTAADLNGYPLPAAPAELPPYVGKPPSCAVIVRDLVEKIWPTDPVFRDRCNSINSATAESGSYQGDKFLAAVRIMEQADKDRISTLTKHELGNKVLSKIARDWLPAALARHGFSRQARIAAAIEHGKLTAATTESGDPAQ